MSQRTAHGTLLSSPDTLHGLLQRGRGAGARRALRTPGAADLVLDCVCHDPRWDNQGESRSHYLAALMDALAVPLDDVRAHLFAAADVRRSGHFQAEDDDRTGSTLSVLGVLAQRGRVDAGQLLRDYAVAGADWGAALDALAEDPDPAALGDGLADAVLAGVDDDLLDRVVGPDSGPWARWAADHPRVARALDQQRAECAEHAAAPDLRESTSDELVAMALGDDLGEAAVRELGERRDPDLLGLVEQLALRGRAVRVRVTAQRQLELFDRAVLPVARDLLARYPTYYWPQTYLVRFGVDRDIDVLLPPYRRSVATGGWSDHPDVPLALGRLGITAALPLLLHAWHRTPYAYARARLLWAIEDLDEAAAQPLLAEGLWDSDDHVRLTAVERLRSPRPFRQRLREMLDDPTEDAEVQEALRSRIARPRRGTRGAAADGAAAAEPPT